MEHSQPHIQKLLEDRYYLRDEQGNLLETSPSEMYLRVATAVASAEKEDDNFPSNRMNWMNKFYMLMNDNKFLPNTPTLINAGKARPGCFSACFVLPVEDSMEGIFDAVKQSALIMKAGGGVGYSFGKLREKNAIVKSTGHKASGPISFMSVFNTMIDTIAQGGTRRGAAIAVLPVWHPDVIEFIEMKDDGISFSNFNISIGITDAFMKAVKEDAQWSLFNPGDYYGPRVMDAVKAVKARDLWDKIIEHAHKTGDPGLVFLDTINKGHPLSEEIETTNPCGEIPLRPYESCNLGSINLMAYLKPATIYDGINLCQEVTIYGEYEFDWDALAEDIPTMVRFLDDVIDVNPFPLPEIDKASKESRKIGLGVMGWADCLIKMQIPYDSQEALDLAELLMRFIKEQAEEASQKLGEEKGLFPIDNSEITGMFRRNATLLCVAPTGTLSRIAGVSSGIEPVFSWKTHHKLVDLEYDETHWAWKEIKEIEKSYNDDTVKVPLPKYMKTANEITPNWHLRMQAAFQKYIDNSVSKTINLPSSATFDDIHEIYRRAWEMGLKGITVYRDGSKVNQPLTSLASDGVIKQAEIKSVVDSVNRIPINLMTEILSKTKTSTEIEKQPLRKRGPVTIGVTHKVDTGKGKIYITVNYNEYHSEPVEVFIRLGHMSTSTENALAEWSGRLLSIMFKYNIPTQCIIKQGNKVFSDSLFWYNKKSFQSLPQLISFLLSFTFEEALEMAEIDIDSMLDSRELLIEESGDIVDGEYCYNCGTYGIIGEGGCKVCHNCGYENCG